MANYTLHDDDEEERRMLEQFLAMPGWGDSLEGERMGIGEMPDPQPPREMPQQAPAMAPPQSAAMPARSPMLSQPQESRHAQPLGTQTGPEMGGMQGYEAPPEAEGQDKTMLWIAAAMDMLLNGGESTPAYVAQLAQNKDTDYTNWQRRNKAMNDATSRSTAQQRAQGRGTDPEMMDLRRRGLALRERGLGTTEDREERLLRKYEEENDPNSARALATREYLVSQGADPRQLEGLTDHQMKSGMNTAQRNAMDLAMGDDMNAMAADKARGVATATMDPKVETARRTAAATHPYKLDLVREGAGIKGAAERANADIDAREPMPGILIVDEQASTAALRDPTERRRLRDAAGGYSVLRQGLKQMEDLRAEYGAELWNGEAVGEYESAHTLAIGGLTQLAASGVLNGGEFDRYKTMIPGIRPKFSDATMVTGQDYTLSQIRGAQRGIGSLVNAKLRPYGVAFETPEEEGQRLGSELDAEQPRKRPPRSQPRAPAGRTVGTTLSPEEQAELDALGGF